MPRKKIEVRGDDILMIRAEVTRVSPDGGQVTIKVWGQKIAGALLAEKALQEPYV